MKETDLLHWIALTQVPGIGPVNARVLVSYCGSPQEVFRQSKNKLLRIPGIGEITAASIAGFKDFSAAESEIHFAEKHRIQILPYTSGVYPERLKQADDAPVVLYYLGSADLNNIRVVAVVGTRKATDYGKEFTQQLISDLAPLGCLVVSGLAYGIDVYAHKAALQQGLPTVGVTAHGMHTLYPAAHKSVAKKMIEEGGGLLTEFTSTQNADKENFPKRNRIVAGMCDALVVVETAVKGGAMITTEIANGYNRDVFALPGRHTDLMSAGCNQLIKTNRASVIESAADLVYLLGWQQKSNKPAKAKPQQHLQNLNISQQAIVNLLSRQERVGIDEISLQLQEESSTLALTLLDMEFNGIIRSLPGKYYQLVSV